MQEEDLYLSFQAGSNPGGQSNTARNPKGGRRNSEVEQTGSEPADQNQCLEFTGELGNNTQEYKGR